MKRFIAFAILSAFVFAGCQSAGMNQVKEESLEVKTGDFVLGPPEFLVILHDLAGFKYDEKYRGKFGRLVNSTSGVHIAYLARYWWRKGNFRSQKEHQDKAKALFWGKFRGFYQRGWIDSRGGYDKIPTETLKKVSDSHEIKKISRERIISQKDERKTAFLERWSYKFKRLERQVVFLFLKKRKSAGVDQGAVIVICRPNGPLKLKRPLKVAELLNFSLTPAVPAG